MSPAGSRTQLLLIVIEAVELDVIAVVVIVWVAGAEQGLNFRGVQVQLSVLAVLVSGRRIVSAPALYVDIAARVRV